jgi:hypothetical protein
LTPSLAGTRAPPKPKEGKAMQDTFSEETDVVLIGAGIMSATVGVFLKEIEPSLTIAMFETLEDCALESTERTTPALVTPRIVK